MTERARDRSIRPLTEISLYFLVWFITWGIVAVTGSLVAERYYVDLEGLERPSQVMEARPNAPGSAAAILARHAGHCWNGSRPSWTDGQVPSGVLLRFRPNDPYAYTSDTTAIGWAIDHVNHQPIPVRLDTVLAFCFDKEKKT